MCLAQRGITPAGKKDALGQTERIQQEVEYDIWHATGGGPQKAKRMQWVNNPKYNAKAVAAVKDTGSKNTRMAAMRFAGEKYPTEQGDSAFLSGRNPLRLY